MESPHSFFPACTRFGTLPLSKQRMRMPRIFLFWTTCLFLCSAQAQSDVKSWIRTDSLRLFQLFQRLHATPELSFQEYATASLVASELKGLGFTVIENIGGTGVLASLDNGPGPTVLFRADMDGLPVQETTGLPYASQVLRKDASGNMQPAMHACGHDAHLTWMLGAARYMSLHRKAWTGRLTLIAQPAEEVGLGADSVQRDPAFRTFFAARPPDVVLGMHTMPFAAGTISHAPGLRMAGVEVFDVTFHGVGGHGSAPHLTKDPVVMAATAILNYQTIVQRSLSVQQPHVITVGSVQAGTVNNIIPASALLKVNIRWITHEDRLLLLGGIDRVNRGIALSFGLPDHLYPGTRYKASLDPLYNDTSLALRLSRRFEKQFPGTNLVNRPPSMVSEDFPILVRGWPSARSSYVFVGVANPADFARAQADGSQYPFYNHNGNFKVDPIAIPHGTAVAIAMMLDCLALRTPAP